MTAAEPVFLGLSGLDWGAVGIACAIVFAILGRKLWADIRGWMA